MNIIINIVAIFVLCFNIYNLKADTDYNVDSFEYPGITDLNASEIYKVKDFYGTWISVGVRFSYPCRNYYDVVDVHNNYRYYYVHVLKKNFKIIHQADIKEIIATKIKKLGKQIIIQPNFYLNQLQIRFKGDDLGRDNVFYSTEVQRPIEDFRNFDPTVFLIGEYELIRILDKNLFFDELSEEPNQFIIKDKNTLIYWEKTLGDRNTFTIYKLIRQEEAKKLDKYVVYMPTRILDDKGETTYMNDEGEIVETNDGKKKATICGKQYDEYAKKLEVEGKYKVIRDSKMARNFIDID